ncbi:MAG: hypothetical protein DMF85_02550, partial [Acidobacteria bacterium]
MKAAITLAGLVLASATGLALHAPPPRDAPAIYTVRLDTTKGPIVIEVHRDWAPRGADRFHELVTSRYYDRSRFFRVIKGQWAQFGIAADPAVASEWRPRFIPDDPWRGISNRRGTVAYAFKDPNGRTTQAFINLQDNSATHDKEPFVVFGRVIEGMNAADALNAEYGESSGGGIRAGQQDPLFAEGEAYLARAFPRLDVIDKASVTDTDTIAPGWTPLASGVTVRLRGVSAVDRTIAWASGEQGTILRTVDGGATWERKSIPGAEKLDFRDVDAIGDRVAYVLSIGPGDASRIYKTADGGATWQLQFTNADPKAFFDAMAFRDEARGVAVSDSVNGRFVIITTADGGKTWTRVPDAALPPALENEGAFAASGTNVAIVGDHIWIGTGAAATSRVLHSRDGGLTWTVAATPLASGPSAGIFSIAFRDARRGIVVGGDYKKEAEAIDNAAVTDDGGATWTLVKGLSGFRSVALYIPGYDAVVAVGPTGTDVSYDDGRRWRAIEGEGFHAASFPPRGDTAFGVGEHGRIGLLLPFDVTAKSPRSPRTAVLLQPRMTRRGTDRSSSFTPGCRGRHGPRFLFQPRMTRTATDR